MAKITITRDDVKDYVFNKFTEYDKNNRIKLPTETFLWKSNGALSDNR